VKPDHYLRIRELLIKVADLADADRQALLDVECRDDPELRREVESLLAHDTDHRAILNTAGAVPDGIGSGPGVEVTTEDSDLPDYIAGYRILYKLGEGGMGEVFLAEQERPLRRRLALKIIKLGMNSKEVMARFESERQALAILNHPNIANIFDAGSTEEGRPYFVMELVTGAPITEYCERNHLGTAERLELFILVCQAIHHAHQNGIIHRDIKPSNVLVTVQAGRAIPKIIDFGVAKATNQRLTERTVYTEQGHLIGTPEYMSPEQADMLDTDIDASTDIFSLGVLLYELLVGALPFHTQMLRKAGLEGMLHIIREVDPPSPSDKASSLDDGQSTIVLPRGKRSSSLAKELRGELDWITMKALAKDRTRRYTSAHDMQDDIRRYLDGDKVLASPPSVSYRFSKAVRRNRSKAFSVGAVVVALVAMVAGATVLVSSLVQSRHGNLAAVEVIEMRIARAVGDRGDFLWTRQMPGRIWPNGRWNWNERSHTIVERNGVAASVVLSLWPDSGPGSLWLLEAGSGDVLWTRDTSWGVAPVNAQGPTIYDWNVLVQWPDRDEQVLAAALRDGDFYSFALQFITLQNEVLGTYYHPGPLYFCDQLSLGESGSALLLYGSNSSSRFVRDFVSFETGIHPGCVVLLDLPGIDGQAYPYSQGLPEYRDWPGMEIARERGYLLIPPIQPETKAEVGVLNVSRNDDGSVSIRANVHDGRIITLDEDLRPVQVYLALNSVADDLYESGEGIFLPYLFIRDGQQEFVDLPIVVD